MPIPSLCSWDICSTKYCSVLCHHCRRSSFNQLPGCAAEHELELHHCQSAQRLNPCFGHYVYVLRDLSATSPVQPAQLLVHDQFIF